ncbi:phosphoribosylamine--glycine ligase [Porphyromonas gingivalis]|uniref:Phosphoribosylamine--glycine ligase n=1 Tax=Porphyromonas gingivalis F0570 TaxID=1227271 RepID=A0A0E2LP67_PORGN|nr:phosphoribosylamine--glycine ligase [Porphyromonas gingivalis]EOA09869.1 phosphoribosylamine--glycine ligase [Porphyromonas gingivalis JCVI SC001]ALA93147.1 phosphoribosylamine--glycine ligase [Porphyromonas gingivalis AJW4]ATS03285.1 phosphoribosylamine--glycine ligase [Porphyromonas gingivalis]EOA11107.1 phosphoribosylamine--glycine ligase [Porphyromonas gingivalis JCVI SC001]ERJ64675.1 phosphoribosylamine--glycine ligase [Porphyromonas gingivalis F0570]
MNILLLGSGGREHALAWKIAQSPLTNKLFVAPGNGGTEDVAINIPEVDVNDFAAVAEVVQRESIDLLVVGPEEPLVRGIVDYFRNHDTLHDLLIVGPDAKGARLEGSKDFSKSFMKRHGIPTAAYQTFTADQTDAGKAFIDTMQAPYVLKADGLAAGKGVIIAPTAEEAKRELAEMLGGKFGAASRRVVIEEFLDGIECSVFVATDGKDYRILPVAKDYKRIGDGDTGLNTGGMGSVSPVPFADEAFMRKVEERIIRPTISGLIAEGIDYRGFIFVGLMNVGGDPYVVEYNCRMGDPETEVVMLRIGSDFVELIRRMAAGCIGDYQMQEDRRCAASVMLVSRGYPGSYEKGMEMDIPIPPADTILFHAGTVARDGKVYTDGGRVMAVSSYGSTPEAALQRCYIHAQQVLFDGKNYRHDIGRDMLHWPKVER